MYAGSGVVVHVPSFERELEDLKQKGLDTEGRIFISDRAHIVFDLHQLVDGLEEHELGNGAVGTTKKGIGPSVRHFPDFFLPFCSSGIQIHIELLMPKCASIQPNQLAQVSGLRRSSRRRPSTKGSEH